MNFAEECYAMIHRKCFNYEMWKHINIHHPDLITVNIYNGKFVTNEKQKVRDTAKIATSPEPLSQDAPPSLHIHNRDTTADCVAVKLKDTVTHNTALWKFLLPCETIYDLSSLLQKDTNPPNSFQMLKYWVERVGKAIRTCWVTSGLFPLFLLLPTVTEWLFKFQRLLWEQGQSPSARQSIFQHP